jgi:hypothetical protein
MIFTTNMKTYAVLGGLIFSCITLCNIFSAKCLAAEVGETQYKNGKYHCALFIDGRTSYKGSCFVVWDSGLGDGRYSFNWSASPKNFNCHGNIGVFDCNNPRWAKKPMGPTGRITPILDPYYEISHDQGDIVAEDSILEKVDGGEVCFGNKNSKNPELNRILFHKKTHTARFCLSR